jgi:hypothetical protein
VPALRAGWYSGGTPMIGSRLNHASGRMIINVFTKTFIFTQRYSIEVGIQAAGPLGRPLPTQRSVIHGRVLSYSEWVAEQAAAGLRPSLTLSRYNTAAHSVTKRP